MLFRFLNFAVWDQSKASRFRWLWHDVTTYESYSEETSYENSLLVQQSGGLALSSLTHVMRSLTPNAQAIFLLLARYQLENKDQTYQGKEWRNWLMITCVQKKKKTKKYHKNDTYMYLPKRGKALTSN